MQYSLTVIPANTKFPLKNCTLCNVGADTVTFLTTVNSVLLVLTLLHS